jgi:AP-3 complex subunit mu
MEYRYLPPAAMTAAALDTSTSLAGPSALAAVTKDVVPIPVSLRPIIELEVNGG